MSTAKFVQITAAAYQLYALDEAGNVWECEEQNRRVCEAPHDDHKCEYQELSWWKPLGAHRGDFPGWPPTHKELAEREVEELLR